VAYSSGPSSSVRNMALSDMLGGSCHSLGGCSSASHRGGRGSVPGGVCDGQSALEQVFFASSHSTNSSIFVNDPIIDVV
jgi:hypothetical protein